MENLAQTFGIVSVLIYLVFTFFWAWGWGRIARKLNRNFWLYAILSIFIWPILFLILAFSKD